MSISQITKLLLKNQIVHSVLVVIASVIIYMIINKIIFKKRKLVSIGNSSQTYINMIKSIIKYIFIIITIIIILQINGVNVTSLLAGLGIFSVVAGLALQDAFKDIIKGFTILSDSYFKVGDVIKYNNIEGKVQVLGLKTTKIRDIVNQNIVSIANRNIEEVEVVSSQLDINVPLGYKLKDEMIKNALKDITEKINKVQTVKECHYIGINRFTDSNIDYLIRIQCDPETKYQTKRDAQVIIYDTLNSYNIEIPYKQVEIHTK